MFETKSSKQIKNTLLLCAYLVGFHFEQFFRELFYNLFGYTDLELEKSLACLQLILSVSGRCLFLELAT